MAASYRHFVPLSPTDVPGVDVTQQLSLSNAYALNRDVLNAEQATSILNAYQQRRRDGVLAEWYGIDPAFPSGSFGAASGLEPGQYVNGGVMPLVGGELARGAFHWGQERYGFDTLDKYEFLLNAYGGGSYLWYEPNGTAGKSNESTVNSDGWGSASMLAALIEGAAGVRDSMAHCCAMSSFRRAGPLRPICSRRRSRCATRLRRATWPTAGNGYQAACGCALLAQAAAHYACCCPPTQPMRQQLRKMAYQSLSELTAWAQAATQCLRCHRRWRWLNSSGNCKNRELRTRNQEQNNESPHYLFPDQGCYGLISLR